MSNFCDLYLLLLHSNERLTDWPDLKLTNRVTLQNLVIAPVLIFAVHRRLIISTPLFNVAHAAYAV